MTKAEKTSRFVETVKRVLMTQDFHDWYKGDWDDYVTGDLDWQDTKAVAEKIDDYIAYEFKELI